MVANHIDESESEHTPGFEEFKLFRKKHWIGSSTPLQLVITGHLFIENVVDQALVEILPNDDKILKLSFTNKITILNGSGLLPENYITKLVQVNKLRNKFAHNLDYELKWTDIRDLGRKDRITKKDWDNNKIKSLRYVLIHIMSYSWNIIEVIFNDKKKF